MTNRTSSFILDHLGNIASHVRYFSHFKFLSLSFGVTNRGDLESNTTFCFSDISVHQVLNNLKQLVISKATGVDKIPAKVLKLSADIIAPSLTTIFNQSLHTGIFVNDWKLARVQPIYKSEDRSKCENYRPISIPSQL